MRLRTLFAAIACSAMLSTGIGFAAAELSRPDTATAAKRGGGQVVRQMKRANRWLKVIASYQSDTYKETREISDRIGTPLLGGGGSLAMLLDDVKDNTEPYVGQRSAKLLYDIERNTSP